MVEKLPATGSIEEDFRGYIPILPDVMANFIELTRNLDTSNVSYANLLKGNTTLTSRIFSYINKTLRTNEKDYISINKGISIMGLHMFKNVVLTFSLFPLFEQSGLIDLFKYSLATAFYCKGIALKYNFINPHDAFLLGFLHDIGKVAIKNKFEEEYKAATLEESLVSGYTIEEETTKFGYSHADIGEYITRFWSLPVVVVDAIKFHHFPLNAMVPQAASIIYLSELLVDKNKRITKEVNNVFNYMQLSKSDLTVYLGKYEKQLKVFSEILDI